MKESNLLIFRDYSVKIGDFGVSIKMKGNPILSQEKDDLYTLKGITLNYVTDYVKSYYDNNENIERK
jgi:hypothetical protein